MRVGRHPGFDRVVWEFAGPGRPTFRVHYVDTPTSEGSGDVVQVGGDAYLEVVVTTVSIPDEGTRRPTDASAASLAGTVVAEANAIFGGFEGYGQSFVGVRGRERPFRVIVLRRPDPARGRRGHRVSRRAQRRSISRCHDSVRWSVTQPIAV